jgi:hypothetical protein
MSDLSVWDLVARAEANRGNEPKVFDWDKAARLIVEEGVSDVDAGLLGDWFPTAGRIFENGAPVKESWAYLCSTWATPAIEINDSRIPCWKMQSETPGWDAKTLWPQSALDILKAS